MKFLYPSPKFTTIILSFVKIILASIFLISAGYSVTHAQETSQELIFKNPVLQSGNEGEKNAVYRFSKVMTGIDALVTISDRSSGNVNLVSIDLANTGFDKAFQPQVTYGNNTSPVGNTDWWMEFNINFVLTNTNIPTPIAAFNLSGLDIDGNNDKISEYATFYGMQSFVLENNSTLIPSVVQERINGQMTNVGERFDGPVANYSNIDTLATKVMVTNNYVGTNNFRLRAGAKSTGVSGAANRMYSFWFKTFSYTAAVTGLLPVTLVNWSAVYASNNVSLRWTTTSEKNTSHFIIERSFDGVEYADAAMLFAAGNSDISINYNYNDKIPAGNSGVIYYRLKVVDADGRNKMSDVRIVRIGKSSDEVKILAYPNPVVNDVRITIPQNWQGKTVSYQLTNTNGQIIKSYTVQYASQTETMGMSQVPTGMYVVRVINGNVTAVQSVVKSNK